jgi:hypothetical protein
LNVHNKQHLVRSTKLFIKNTIFMQKVCYREWVASITVRVKTTKKHFCHHLF